MTCLILAFIDPHLLINDQTGSSAPREGMAIYLLLDRSGSMNDVVEQEVRGNTWHAVTKFKRLQEAAIAFIDDAPSDLIGVIALARGAQIISPLTLDHALLKKRIEQLSVIQDKTQDGTAIGYAIYKTAHLISTLNTQRDSQGQSPYTIKSSAMIVITDGLQDPSYLDRGNPLRTMDLSEAADYAHGKNIHVYIVNVDKHFKEEAFAPNRHEMERVTATTGGKLIILNQLSDLQIALSDIQTLEKSKIYETSASPMKKIPFYPYLISLGLILIGSGTILNMTLFRKVL